MGVNATKKSGRHLLSCTRLQLVFASWVMIKERGNVMNEPAN